MKLVAASKRFSHEALTSVYALIRFIGLDNLNRTRTYLLYSTTIIYFSFAMEIFGLTVSYVKHATDMPIGNLLTSLQVGINVYVIIPKMIALYLSMEKLRETAPILEKLDAKIQSEEEIREANIMAKNGRRLVLIFLTIYITYAVATFVSAIFHGRPPYSLYLPFCNWEESKKQMVIASSIEFYLIIIICIQDAALDSYPVVFVYIAVKQIQILCIRVRNLGVDSTKSKEEHLKALVACIQNHIEFLDFIDKIRTVISRTLFSQLIAVAIVIATAIVNIMLFSDIGDKVASIFFLIAVILETLPICYSMNVLKDEMDILPISAFHCNWIDQNKEFRKMILFLMQHAQKEISIIAGNIIPVDIDTFLRIGKLSFSVYALVSEMVSRKGDI